MTFEEAWKQKPGLMSEYHNAAYWYNKGRDHAHAEIEQLKAEVENLRQCLKEVENDLIWGIGGPNL